MLLDYKGTRFYFTPASDTRESDNLVCDMQGLSYAELYKKAYELLSAIAFPEEAKVLLGGGLTDVRIVDSLTKMNIRQIERRQFPVQESRLFLRGVALIENEEQETLLRLFRQAYSAIDAYSQLLFYWHTLVYPDKNENNAIRFINDHFAEIEHRLTNYRDGVKDRLFQKDDTFVDLGTYIKNGARHSIAHIVRDWKTYNSLELDDLAQIWHVQYLADILEQLCRLKLSKFCNIRIGNKPGVIEFLESRPI